MPAIFDFDLTLTIDHTFRRNSIAGARLGADHYFLGQQDGMTNIKSGVDSVLKHDEQGLSAVATYHNNPEFVAGNISAILNKELTCSYTIRKIIVNADSSEQTEIAMNFYNVAGIDKPFLISYLPHEGNKFQSAIDILRNKNAQISAIRDFWLTERYINSTDHIDFYEDTRTNFNDARSLGYINGYLVMAGRELTVEASYEAPRLRPTPPQPLVMEGPELTVVASQRGTQPDGTSNNNPRVLSDDSERQAITSTRSGLGLLRDTLVDVTDNSCALGRVLKAIDTGTLTVNGQTPDVAYSIGEYLVHGGRIKFDVSELNPEDQDIFFDYITNKQAKARTFATHRVGGIDASGSPAEAKSGFFGAVGDLFRRAGVYLGIAQSKHYGINLAIGGSNIANREGESLGINPDESGQWGHMYLHKDSGIVLVGIEPSGPGQTNKRTAEDHSTTGESGTFSPFLEKKINSPALQQDQLKSGKEPLSVEEKYNWATVKMTSAQLNSCIDATIVDNNVSLVEKTPSNATKAESNRTGKMKAWAIATKEANKPSLLAKVMGGLLIAAGIVVAAVPIPIVTQAIGGSMAALGVAVATGVVGLGLLFSDIRGSKHQAESRYNEYLNSHGLAASKNPDGSSHLFMSNALGSAAPEDEQVEPVQPFQPVQPVQPVQPGEPANNPAPRP